MIWKTVLKRNEYQTSFWSKLILRLCNSSRRCDQFCVSNKQMSNFHFLLHKTKEERLVFHYCVVDNPLLMYQIILYTYLYPTI